MRPKNKDVGKILIHMFDMILYYLFFKRLNDLTKFMNSFRLNKNELQEEIL